MIDTAAVAANPIEEIERKFIQRIEARLGEIEGAIHRLVTNNSLTERPWIFGGEALTKKTSLQRLKRKTFSVRKGLEELKTSVEMQMGLDLMAKAWGDRCRVTQALRERAAHVFLRVDDLARSLKSTGTSLAGKVSPDVFEAEARQEKEAKRLRRVICQVFLDIPECGMTIQEWLDLSPADRQSLRAVGRPPVPDEVLIMRGERDLQALISLVTHKTNGAMATVEAIVADVTQASQGRPPVSDLARMDRRLMGYSMELQKLEEDVFYSEENNRKKDRLKQKINGLRGRIAAGEQALVGIEKLRRELEKVRSRHRDLSVAEVGSTARKNALIMLELMRNEVAQQEVASQILALNPQEPIALNHKVNPRVRHERFDKLRRNPYLTNAEKTEVMALNQAILDYPNYRKR